MANRMRFFSIHIFAQSTSNESISYAQKHLFAVVSIDLHEAAYSPERSVCLDSYYEMNFKKLERKHPASPNAHFETTNGNMAAWVYP